ncbi:hypothetical protein MTR_4g055160 [Medicago truncatula]|uniref:Uncharacterized protein n=1 Tax=Medicago truncatula TaxID=3880 RepID=G7JKY0_MEDTR|nr:hypothetical protein MTR_4g055160 [Medicago truncatula]
MQDDSLFKLILRRGTHSAWKRNNELRCRRSLLSQVPISGGPKFSTTMTTSEWFPALTEQSFRGANNFDSETEIRFVNSDSAVGPLRETLLDFQNNQKDPACVIKEAPSKVLVYNYPLAGKEANAFVASNVVLKVKELNEKSFFE